MQTSTNNSSGEMILDIKKLAQLRAEAFVQGTRFVLEQRNINSLIIQAQMDALLLETKHLIKQKETKLNQYNRIVNQLIKKLSQISGLNHQEIALGEAYWAWQTYARPKRTTHVHFAELGAVLNLSESVIQPQLTASQKEMLLQVHQTPKPVWAHQLAAWELHYLQIIIPQKINGDWSSYQKVLPATLRRIPGLSNATQKTIKFTDSTGKIFTKRSYRQGVPTAYAMPPDYYQPVAEENIKQMINAIQTDVKEDFQRYWNLSKSSPIKAPLLLLGLLTHKEHGNILQTVIDTKLVYTDFTLSGEENNTQRTQDKSAAIDSIQKQDEYPGLKLIDLNIGVNIGRGWLTGVPIDDFIAQVVVLLESIQATTTSSTESIQARLQEATTAIAELKAHNVKPLTSGRNKDLFTAALCHYVTEKLGGSVVTNCKSAKDRTGLEIMMADAIDIYTRAYAQIPRYDETDEIKRQHFIHIFKAIFDSQHHQLIASDNSPGSQGIKDEGMLDSDIAKSLGETYTLGKNIAGLNKPKSFFEKNQNILLGTLLFLGTIASIGLIISGVFAPLGLILGYGVLSVGLPYAISFGIFSGYAAYDAHQNVLATKKHAHVALSEAETSLLFADDDIKEKTEEETLMIGRNNTTTTPVHAKEKLSLNVDTSTLAHSTHPVSHTLFKRHTEPEVKTEEKTQVEIKHINR